jgi:two-component system KDP operon response regulator KdpE
MDLAILIIEDEPAIVRTLEPTLQASGATVLVAWSGSQAMEHLRTKHVDVILCDLGLPDMEGETLIPKLRELSDAPVIVLSARGMEHDKIGALDAGADDFVSKPFSSGELLARIRANARRANIRPPEAMIDLGDFRVDLNRRRVILDETEIRLSRREHMLVTLLAKHPDRTVTHRQIIDEVWGSEARADTQFVRVLVGQLRQKLEEDPANPQIICTEPGQGYRLAISSADRS